MEISPYEITMLVVCFIASGFFSGSEAVLMSIGIDRAMQLIEGGGSKAGAMTFMVERPNELLSTILVGNNIANIFAASLTTAICTRIFASDAIGIAVGLTTILILVFGEIIPKSFSRTHAEKLAVFVIRVLQFLYYLLYPIVKSMVLIIRVVLGENADLNGRLVTKNDLEYLVSRAEKEKTMDSKQLDLIASVLEFPKIKVKDIMIPRSKVKYIKSEWSLSEVMEYIQNDVHSRYPVCSEELENMLGFLHVKDLVFLNSNDEKKFKLKKHLKSPFFVYEHMKIQAVFDHMNRKKIHMALVKDENGIVVGIITLEDIVEEILGEIQDEHDAIDLDVDQEYSDVDLEEGVVVAGEISLRDLDTDYEIKIPLNDSYSTLTGFVLDMLGNNFPEEGQIIVWEGLVFELSKVEDYEIKEIRIRDVDGEKHLFSKKEASEASDTEELDEADRKKLSEFN